MRRLIIVTPVGVRRSIHRLDCLRDSLPLVGADPAEQAAQFAPLRFQVAVEMIWAQRVVVGHRLSRAIRTAVLELVDDTVWCRLEADHTVCAMSPVAASWLAEPSAFVAVTGGE